MFLILNSSRPPPKRMQLTSYMPISTPIRSPRFTPGLVNEWQIMASRVTSASTSLVHSKVDLSVWIEICELGSDGQYLPVVVDQHDDTPCKGTFLLHQGIQRRIRVTIIHHPDYDVHFKDLRELVIGRIRPQLDCSVIDDENDPSIISLSLFFTEHLEPSDDGRERFRFEAAWDSSLHNSILLNRITPSSERVFLTMSAYLDIQHCSQPGILTKDLCMMIYGRDSRTIPTLMVSSHPGLSTRVLKDILTGSYKNAESNHVMAIFELVLRRSLEAGSPGLQRRQRRVLDTSATYVRGQENLGNWQPRGDSLIFDHQWELEKLTRLESVEQMKHFLLIRSAKSNKSDEFDDDLLGAMSPIVGSRSIMKTSSSKLSLAALASTNLSSTATALISPASNSSANSSLPRSSTFSSGIDSLNQEKSEYSLTDRERYLASKCLKMIQFHVPSQLAPIMQSPSPPRQSSTLNLPRTPTESNLCLASNASTPEISTPERNFASNAVQSWFEKEKELFDSTNKSNGNCGFYFASEGFDENSTNNLFIPEIEEIRLSSIISKKGFIHCLMSSNEFKLNDESESKRMGDARNATQWRKLYMIVRRPYMFVYRDEKDLVERSIINLTQARVECSEQQRQMLCVENAFSVITKHTGYLFKAQTARDMYDWLYSINPLYAGQLMCEWARSRNAYYQRIRQLKNQQDSDLKRLESSIVRNSNDDHESLNIE